MFLNNVFKTRKINPRWIVCKPTIAEDGKMVMVETYSSVSGFGMFTNPLEFGEYMKSQSRRGVHVYLSNASVSVRALFDVPDFEKNGWEYIRLLKSNFLFRFRKGQSYTIYVHDLKAYVEVPIDKMGIKDLISLVSFLYEKFNQTGMLCVSTAQYAFREARKTMDGRVEKHSCNICENSYFHGHTEALVRGNIKDIATLDMNSAYAWAATNPLPKRHLDTFEHSTIAEVNQLVKSGFGVFAKCKVKVPGNVKIAPFPYRDQVLGIIYPCGEFITFLSGIEIVKYSAYVEEIYATEVFSMSPYLRDFVLQAYTKRINCTDKIERGFWKQVLVATYGKFAEKPVSLIYEPRLDTVGSSIDSIEGELDGTVHKYQKWGVKWYREEKAPHSVIFPAVSAMITAYLRIRMAELFERVSDVNVIYYDIDALSVYAKDLMKLGGYLGDAIGEFKIEYTGDINIFSTFAYMTAAKRKVPGLPLSVTPEVGDNTFTRFKGFGEGAKDKLETVTKHFTISVSDFRRDWNENDSLPLKIDQINQSRLNYILEHNSLYRVAGGL